MNAIVLAGGLGTRLRKVINDLPKCMAPVKGRPFLEYVLDELNRASIETAVLSVGYKKNAIIDHFKSSYKDLKIQYALEEEPLGTGGAIKNAFSSISDECVCVVNGDTLFSIDYHAFYQHHLYHRADISLALRPVQDASRYGTVDLNRQSRIVAFREKKQEPSPGLINGGIYMIGRTYFLGLPLPSRFSLEKDCFERYVHEGNFVGYRSETFFIDIGIPEDYAKAKRDL